MAYEVMSEILRIGLPTIILFILIVSTGNKIMRFIEKKVTELQRREAQVLEKEHQQKEVDEARRRINLK